MTTHPSFKLSSLKNACILLLFFNNVETAGDVECSINNKFGTTLEGNSSSLMSGQPNVPGGAWG
jgi:hypothetical protein